MRDLKHSPSNDKETFLVSYRKSVADSIQHSCNRFGRMIADFAEALISDFLSHFCILICLLLFIITLIYMNLHKDTLSYTKHYTSGIHTCNYTLSWAFLRTVEHGTSSTLTNQSFYQNQYDYG